MPHTLLPIKSKCGNNKVWNIKDYKFYDEEKSCIKSYTQNKINSFAVVKCLKTLYYKRQI